MRTTLALMPPRRLSDLLTERPTTARDGAAANPMETSMCLMGTCGGALGFALNPSPLTLRTVSFSADDGLLNAAARCA